MDLPENNIDQNWKELVRYLLLGTDQLPLSAEVLSIMQALGVEQEENHQMLLEAVSLTHLLQKGAPRSANVSFTVPEPAKPSAGGACSWRSVQHLQAILNGHHLPALPEFVQLLHTHNKQLPADSLPVLLEQCRANPDLWELVRPIIGERGLWLMRQHPHWSNLEPQVAALEEWPEQSGKTQLFLLQAYRKVDSAAARESLTDHWLQLDHKTQARLLPALSEGLKADDEAFLEHCLQAKRKEVRKAAANLLSRLADSQLVGRLWGYAQSSLLLKDGKVICELPEELPRETEADGIYPTGSKTPGGLKLNWLQQIVAGIPLLYWVDHWKKTPWEIIHLIANGPHSTTILNAFTESLIRFPDTVGTEAVIKWWLLSGQESLWNNNTAKQLLKQTSVSFFNESQLRWLEQFGPLVPADSLPAYWLTNSTHSWAPALSKIIVLGFQDVLQGRRTANWDLWHYRRLFEAAAYHSDPQLLDQFKSGWSFRSASFGRWHADLEKMLQILHFRREMIAELKKP